MHIGKGLEAPGRVHEWKSDTVLDPGLQGLMAPAGHTSKGLAPPVCQSHSGLQLLTSGASGTGDVTIPVLVSQWVEVTWGH